MSTDLTSSPQVDESKRAWERVLALAGSFSELHIEGEEILHSDEQGFYEAFICVDKWLSFRDGGIRMQVRVLARSDDEQAPQWECISEGGFSEPLSEAQAMSLVAHWAALGRAKEAYKESQGLRTFRIHRAQG